MLICSGAQPAGFHPVKDESLFRKKFSETSAGLRSIQADFTQVKNLVILSEKITSKGRFWFMKQNKVRMEYSSPYKYLMVIHGEKMMVKDDVKTTTLSSRNNKMLEYVNRIIIDCVQGTAIDSRDFKNRIFENNGNFLIEMAPVKKEMRDYFSAISLYIDKGDYSVSRMDMTEPGGDNTIFTFINRKFNEAIPDSLFRVD
jgi:outer membrane lipoprotein-sorting protein